nr:hypothetical protein CFP56_21230 [Quercus suber]
MRKISAENQPGHAEYAMSTTETYKANMSSISKGSTRIFAVDLEARVVVCVVRWRVKPNLHGQCYSHAGKSIAVIFGSRVGRKWEEREY